MTGADGALKPYDSLIDPVVVTRRIDRFYARDIAPERLRTVTAAAARSQGELRETHLKYHLSTAALLDPEQMQRYASLRGYQGPDHHQHHQ